MTKPPVRGLHGISLGTSRVVLGGAGALMNRGREVSDDEASRIASRAVRRGVRLVDTSPIYGSDADPRMSERRLGTVLAAHAEVRVATKVGLRRDVGLPVLQLMHDEVTESVLESSRTLKRECLDLVQIHELTDATWSAVFRNGGALDTLEQLRAEGRVGSIGVTGSDPDVLRRALDTGRFDAVQVWKSWNLLNRSAEGLLNDAHLSGIGVLVAGPFASGILASDQGGEFHYSPASPVVRETVTSMIELCREYGVPIRAAALQFCLDSRVDAVVVGVDSEDQLDEVFQAMQLAIPAELMRHLNEMDVRC